MLRVLHIAPGIDGGGVGGVIYNYLSHMNRAEMYVEVLVRDYGHRQFLHGRFDEMNIKVHYVTQRKKSLVKHFQEVFAIMKAGRFDVVHCHDQNWSYLYLKMAKRLGIPVRIAHSHLTVQTTDKLKIALSNLLTPALKRVATGYFGCGVAAGAYMWGEDIAHSSKLYVMKNAVAADRFAFNRNARDEYRKQLQLEGKTVLGHIGRFNEQKNHVFLIRIFQEYLALEPDAMLVLIGIGELEETIREQVKALGIEKNMLFLGQRNDVPLLYNAFDVFLLPSLYEGLPVVGVEAQANGLPCFFSNTISDEVVILPSSQVISLEESPRSWAERIHQCIGTMDLEQRMQAVGQLNTAGYNIYHEAEKLKQYYLAEFEQGKKK